jgi:hypothetical protein
MDEPEKQFFKIFGQYGVTYGHVIETFEKLKFQRGLKIAYPNLFQDISGKTCGLLSKYSCQNFIIVWLE